MEIPDSIFKATVEPWQWSHLTYAGNSLYGMPHYQAHYKGSGIATHTLDEDATCMICGQRATNAHHAPQGRIPFMMRAPKLKEPQLLFPALIALCGSGTTGCHGHVHGQVQPHYGICWEWDSQEDANLHWSGELFKLGYQPHDPRYFSHGCICVWEAGGEDHIARYRSENNG